MKRRLIALLELRGTDTSLFFASVLQTLVYSLWPLALQTPLRVDVTRWLGSSYTLSNSHTRATALQRRSAPLKSRKPLATVGRENEYVRGARAFTPSGTRLKRAPLDHRRKGWPPT